MVMSRQPFRSSTSPTKAARVQKGPGAARRERSCTPAVGEAIVVVAAD